MDDLFAKNKKTNKNIAMVVLLAIFVQALGLANAVGLDLSTVGVAGFSVLKILQIVGTGWIAAALHKHKIGN